MAEAPEVAKEYQNMVRAEVNGKPFAPGPFDPEFGALNELHKSKNDYAAARKTLEERAIRQKVDLTPEINALNDMEAKSVKANLGQLYKVDLPDEQIAKMLDWDKPLVGQPKEIREFAWANQEPLKRYAEAQGEKGIFGLTGNDLYTQLLGDMDAQQVSKMMNEAGIPGIQYLDQASRGAGDGTRNYVVFSDEIPQILERNNVPVKK